MEARSQYDELVEQERGRKAQRRDRIYVSLNNVCSRLNMLNSTLTGIGSALMLIAIAAIGCAIKYLIGH